MGSRWLTLPPGFIPSSGSSWRLFSLRRALRGGSDHPRHPPAALSLPQAGSEVFLDGEICPWCQLTCVTHIEARTHLFQLRIKLLSINKQTAKLPGSGEERYYSSEGTLKVMKDEICLRKITRADSLSKDTTSSVTVHKKIVVFSRSCETVPISCICLNERLWKALGRDG